MNLEEFELKFNNLNEKNNEIQNDQITKMNQLEKSKKEEILEINKKFEKILLNKKLQIKNIKAESDKKLSNFKLENNKLNNDLIDAYSKAELFFNKITSLENQNEKYNNISQKDNILLHDE